MVLYDPIEYLELGYLVAITDRLVGNWPVKDN